MATQSTSEQADNPPDYDSIQPRRAAIQCIRTPAAPEPPSGSSQAFKVNGTIYVAAQAANMPRGGHLAESIASAERMIRNIEAILKAAGSGLDRIVKTTVYFTENMWVHLIDDFEALYKRILPFAPPRTTVFVPRIGTKGNKQEIQMEVIAVE
ncbi:hypothetical protein N7471_007835 [Penicillium samsonianum]|uniref:uncharacterized protein n=1 Tax=Penicillium samsonianum TaxID=1882272 RepID=UPI0025486DFB|nr:uncharacterized protein N7471_007835 [Penicillium samsonianum]KAJ6132620.1 hypothetical protein N7471_007835 [Penicillium samsonianum]